MTNKRGSPLQSPSRKTLILYGTIGCHLCEHARALLLNTLADKPYQLREVDIADSNELMTRYGVRIPVLSDSNDSDNNPRELDWPFDAAELEAWLSE